MGVVQVVKYVNTSQYIGEFEMLILSSPIVIGEFWVIYSYAVMLIWRELLKFSSFWREIKLHVSEYVHLSQLVGLHLKSSNLRWVKLAYNSELIPMCPC